MFARLVRLQLGMIPGFTAASRGTVTLPQQLRAHGDVETRMGETDRAGVFAIYDNLGLHLRIYFAPNLYVNLRPDQKPEAKGDDVCVSVAAHVFKDGAEIMHGPWAGMLRAWRPDAQTKMVLVEVRDLNVELRGGPDFVGALERHLLGLA